MCLAIWARRFESLCQYCVQIALPKNRRKREQIIKLLTTNARLRFMFVVRFQKTYDDYFSLYISTMSQ